MANYNLNTLPEPALKNPGDGWDEAFLRNLLLQLPDLESLRIRDKPQVLKKSFLVFKNQKYTTVKTENVAFFFIRNNVVSLMCFNKQIHTLNRSLDQIAACVSQEQFFRVNRQYLVNFNAIKEVEPYFMRKLYLRLFIEPPEKLYIAKEKSTAFLSWMEER